MSEKNIFEKIIDKEVSAHIVYEDDNFMVFLDHMPEAPGHCLVIPKTPARRVWDVERYDEYWELSRKVAKALQKAFSTEMIICKIVGEEVPHAHIKLFPAVASDGSEKEFEKIVEKIKKFL